MSKQLSLVLRPASLKLHSVVYAGETKQGQRVSFYVPWEIIKSVTDLPTEKGAGLEALPRLQITFEEDES